LQLGLLGEEVIHFRVGHFFGEFCGHFIKAVHQSLGLGHAFHDIA